MFGCNQGTCVSRRAGRRKSHGARPTPGNFLRRAISASAAPMTPQPTRVAGLTRTTSETEIALTLDLDGSGRSEIATGIGFLDHMLTSLARHALFDRSEERRVG